MAIYTYCIPDFYFESINNIPYHEFKKQGKKALLFDLDNTIIDYHEEVLDLASIEFIKELSKDFKVLVISNSGKKRVEKAVAKEFPFVYHATKPLKRGFKKAIKFLDVSKDDVVMIGDQLMTDVYGGNKMGFTTVLVDAKKRKTDRFYTRLNRKIERYFINKIKKKDPASYERVLKVYDSKNQ